MLKERMNRIANNAYVYSVFSKIVCVGLGMIYSILFARYFGAQYRGEAAVILNYVSLFDVILCLGIYQAYPYYKKNTAKEEKESFRRSFINDTMGLFCLYSVICVILAIFWQGEADYRILFLMLPFAFLVKMLNYVVLIDTPRIRNRASMILYLIDIFLLILLFIIYPKINIYICFGFLIIKQIYYAVIAFTNTQLKIFEIRPTISKEIPKYIRYGWLPMLTVLMMSINYKIDTIMLDHYSFITKVDIGIYALGVGLADKIWIIPDALKDILLSKLANGKDKSEVEKICRISLAITLICILGIAVLGKPLIRLMYGEEYIDSYGVTLIIVMGGIGMVFYKMIYSFNVINARRVENLVLLVISALFNVIMNLILIPSYGIIGAAFASLISYLVCGFMFMISFIRYTGSSFKKLILLQTEDIEMLKSLRSSKQS